MKLLIDFGNTRLKWALHDSSTMHPGGVFAHAEQRLAVALHNDWMALSRRPEAVLVASVVSDQKEAELTALCRSLFNMDPTWIKTPSWALGVRNGYAEPGQLGVDRFLALAALHAESARPQMLANCGTALTLDALGADGRHHGGLIVASPTLMRSALRSATARIGSRSGSTVELATATADAVQSGAVLAAVALIERFRRQCAGRVGGLPALVVCGGGSAELSPWLPDSERRNDLVLRGLACWAESEVAA